MYSPMEISWSVVVVVVVVSVTSLAAGELLVVDDCVSDVVVGLELK